MGNPKIFWYPAGSTSFQTITLPHVSGVHVDQFRDVVDAEGLTMTRLDRGGGRIVTIRGRYNVAANAPVIRSLQTLDSHLRAGGRIAFCLDSDKAFMTRTVWPSYTGTATLNVDVNVLPFGSVTLAADDELLIQQTAPLRYERAAMSGSPTAAPVGAEPAAKAEPVLRAPATQHRQDPVHVPFPVHGRRRCELVDVVSYRR